MMSLSILTELFSSDFSMICGHDIYIVVVLYCFHHSFTLVVTVFYEPLPVKDRTDFNKETLNASVAFLVK